MTSLPSVPCSTPPDAFATIVATFPLQVGRAAALAVGPASETTPTTAANTAAVVPAQANSRRIDAFLVMDARDLDRDRPGCWHASGTGAGGPNTGQADSGVVSRRTRGPTARKYTLAQVRHGRHASAS